MTLFVALVATSASFMAPTSIGLAPTSIGPTPFYAHRTMSSPLMKTNIPRITLPAAVGNVLGEAELKNPNDLDDEAYNTYSAAAIGGTLILFLLPLFDLLGFIGDFIFSALIGGGALAYAALRKDVVGEYANKAGGYVMLGIDKVVEQTPTVKAKIEELIKQLKE